MKRVIKKVLAVTLSLVVLLQLMPVQSYAEEWLEVTVSAYDYSAIAAGLSGASKTGIVMEEKVFVNKSDANAKYVLEQAFSQAQIEQTGLSTGYISSINGLDSAAGGGYSGWYMAYYDAASDIYDDFGNSGISSLTQLNNGDKLEFHYSVNTDTITDDIGHGWYGIPIITSISLPGYNEIKCSKTTVYDENYNSSTSYFRYDGIDKIEMDGKGTQEEPFKISFDIPGNAQISTGALKISTSLNEHYVNYTDFMGNPITSYSNPLRLKISNRGGHSCSYYEISLNRGEDIDLPDKEYSSTLAYIQENSKSALLFNYNEWEIIARARADKNDNSIQNILVNYYRSIFNNLDANGRLRKVTDTAKAVIAINSVGGNITRVNGQNLINAFKDFDYVSGQGINGLAYVLIAVNSSDYSDKEIDEIKEQIINKLIEQSLNTGGWTFSGNQADVDITAAVICALAPYYETNASIKEKIDEAVEMLSKCQNSDAGYSSFGQSNSESVSQVITALTSLRINPLTDERFIKNGNNMIDCFIDNYYAENGGFGHTNHTVDSMATVQAYIAMTSLYRMINCQTSFYDMSDQTVEDNYYKGDINGDQSINSFDALMILKHKAKLYNIDEYIELADVNLDLKTDAEDALNILKLAAHIIDEF